MKRRRYPFEALRDLRRRAVDDRRVETAQRQTERRVAEQALERAKTTRQRAEQAVTTLEQSEQDRLEEGRARAADLQQQGAWCVGIRKQLERLATGESSARQTEREADAAEQLARARLARSDADQRALERHEQAWQQRRATAEELAAEEEVSDGHAARRQRPGSRGGGSR